jgi:hypothetical protein
MEDITLPLVLLGCISIVAILVFIKKSMTPIAIGAPRVSMFKFRHKRIGGFADCITEAATRGGHDLVVVDFPFSYLAVDVFSIKQSSILL